MSHNSPTPNPESGPRPSGPPQTHTAPRALAQEFEDDLRRRLVHRAAKMALVACMDGDDADAADHIDSLTGPQLEAVQNAAVALSLHVSRLRKAREDGHDHADAEPVPGTDAAMAALRPHLAAIDALWRRAEQAEAAVQRVRDLAEDMRTWCSPYGMAPSYADRIIAALHLKETP